MARRDVRRAVLSDKTGVSSPASTHWRGTGWARRTLSLTAVQRSPLRISGNAFRGVSSRPFVVLDVADLVSGAFILECAGAWRGTFGGRVLEWRALAKLEKGLFAVTAIFAQICSGWFSSLPSILIVETPLVVRGVKNTTFFLQPSWTETAARTASWGLHF